MNVNCCYNCIYYGEFSELIIPENLGEIGFYSYERVINSRVLISRCLNCISDEDERINH